MSAKDKVIAKQNEDVSTLKKVLYTDVTANKIRENEIQRLKDENQKLTEERDQIAEDQKKQLQTIESLTTRGHGESRARSGAGRERDGESETLTRARAREQGSNPDQSRLRNGPLQGQREPHLSRS